MAEKSLSNWSEPDIVIGISGEIDASISRLFSASSLTTSSSHTYVTAIATPIAVAPRSITTLCFTWEGARSRSER
jgi:hypothetical protein